MHKFIFKRTLMLIPVLLGVIIVTFTLFYFTPGDPARIILGEQAPEQAVLDMREELGLNDPYIVRLADYIWGALRFDFGRSWRTRNLITEEIGERFVTTMQLVGMGLIVATIIGIPFGILSATKQYSILDTIMQFIALVGVSIPNFWLAMMLALIFGVYLEWLPTFGWDGWQWWILPVITVASNSIATLMRFTRSSMLEVIRSDYIRTARAKGLKESLVIIKHALKNALMPVITILGLMFGGALGGAVLTETIFSIPGLGRYLVTSINFRDGAVILTGTLFLAFSFSLANLIVDIMYAYIDPRVRSQYK